MRHSELINENDLHYAKVRIFAGNPAVIAPDFINQLLIASDTNKLYRATSANAGGLIPLVAVSDGSGNGGTIIGEGSPQTPPSAIGETYFDSISGIFWCSINFAGNPSWVSSVPPVKVVSVFESISELVSLYPDVSGYFSVYHRADFLPAVQQTIDINTFTQIGTAINLESLIAQHGKGAYVFGFELDDPNNEVSEYEVYVSFQTLNYTDQVMWVSAASLNYGRHSNGFLYVGAERRLGVDIEISLSLQSVS